jgi:chromosome segregation ATPase
MRLKLNLKSTGQLIIATAVISLMVACNTESTTKKIAKLETATDSLVTVIFERDSLINEMIEAFNEIELDLAFIREQRNMISVTSDDEELGKDKKEQIIQDVKDLATLLEESRKRIITLNSKLKKSGINVASLEKQIVDLNSNLETRNTEILALTEELEKKNYEVGVLNDQVQVLETTKIEQEMRIKVQEDELNDMNKAYYALGTSKELKEKGVVTKEGGFLGMGRIKMLNKNIDENDFSEIDIRRTQSIPVNSEKVNLISEHPNGSYEFVKDTTNHIEMLAINNPDEFYKFTRYIVLEVK